MNPQNPPSSFDALPDDELGSVVRRSLSLRDAPPQAVQAAIELWPRPSSVADRARAALSRVTAMLTFDSWAAAPLSLGMRAVPSDTRHLLFSADGRDIDLRIVPAAEQFSLSGQILGPDDAGDVELRLGHDGDDPLASHVAALDSLGEFRFETVSRGTYVLTFRLSGGEIVLAPIDVGGRRR